MWILHILLRFLVLYRILDVHRFLTFLFSIAWSIASHVIYFSIFVTETFDCNSFFRIDLTVQSLILPLSVNIGDGTGTSSCDKVLEHLRFICLLVDQLPLCKSDWFQTLGYLQLSHAFLNISLILLLLRFSQLSLQIAYFKIVSLLKFQVIQRYQCSQIRWIS